jgi:hypothetical protein
MTDRYPVDLADAAKPREAAAYANDEPLHDARCRDGWLGDDDQDRPIPCLVCRPHLTRNRDGSSELP